MGADSQRVPWVSRPAGDRMTQEKMAKLAAQLERAESRLLRAITKWMKLRRQVKAAGAKLDKGLAEELEKLPGKLDVRDMGIPAKPWPKGKGAKKKNR